MKYMSLLLISGLVLMSSSYVIAQEAVETASSSSADGGKRDPTKSLTEVAKTIQSSSKVLQINLKTADPAIASQAAKDLVYLQSYINEQNKCADKEAYTTYLCLEKTNPKIAQALPIIQALVASMSGGLNDACSSFAKAMDVANKALLAYQTGCAGAKALCQISCGGTTDRLKMVIKSLDPIITEAQMQAITKNDTNTSNQIGKNYGVLREAIEKDLAVSEPRSVAGKASTCVGYSKEIASALVGGIGIIQSMGKANKCDEETTAVTPIPTATPVDCTIEANQTNNQECICKAAPRTPGCSGGLDNNLNSKSADIMRGADAGSYTPAANTGANTGVDGLDGDSLFGGGSGDGSSSSGPGAPVGGNSAGIDGGSGFGGGGPSKEEKSGSGLNTNILGGEGGGGGGGGGWGGYSSDEGGGNGLRQYLPGGERDPAAQKMAGQGGVKDITSQSGKTNWEKVRERYRDNKTTLLGN